VRALVRPRSLERFHRSPLASLGIEAAAGDLTDAAAVARAVEGVDIVYHVAATYREAGQTAASYRAINVEGTRHVLESAARAGVRRVVHCSTGGVHGHVAHPPANEDAPLRPGDIYQETKLEAEQLARDIGRTRGLDVVVARPIGIYGPGDTRFLKMFRGLARGRFPVLGSGEVYYHLTYIDDLIEGFRLCGEVPAAAGRTYLLAGPRYTTLNELIRLIAAELKVAPPRWRWPVWPFWMAGLLCEAVCVPFGIEPPLYRRRVDFFTKSRAFDTTRARTELGYAPSVDLEEGIRRTADWYRAQGWL
jgi:nucleoside-diphosphate-sugar epimerase